jgi:hypothetical protein
MSCSFAIVASRVIAQMHLLAHHLRLQLGILRFEIAQATDVRAVGGADEMGEHVHLAEDGACEVLGGVRVRKDGPIATWNLGPLDRACPEGLQLIDAPGAAELRHRRPVPPVQRLLQELGADIPLAGEKDCAAMQLVVGLLARAGQYLDQDLAQLCGGQTGADDGAVEIAGQLPDAPALGLGTRLLGRLGEHGRLGMRRKDTPVHRKGGMEARQLDRHRSVYPHRYIELSSRNGWRP